MISARMSCPNAHVREMCEVAIPPPSKLTVMIPLSRSPISSSEDARALARRRDAHRPLTEHPARRVVVVRGHVEQQSRRYRLDPLRGAPDEILVAAGHADHQRLPDRARRHESMGLRRTADRTAACRRSGARCRVRPPLRPQAGRGRPSVVAPGFSSRRCLPAFKQRHRVSSHARARGSRAPRPRHRRRPASCSCESACTPGPSSSATSAARSGVALATATSSAPTCRATFCACMSPMPAHAGDRDSHAPRISAHADRSLVAAKRVELLLDLDERRGETVHRFAILGRSSSSSSRTSARPWPRNRAARADA